MILPWPINRSYQAVHWLITFCSSSGERFLSHFVPRNNSMYSDVVCVLILLVFLSVILGVPAAGLGVLAQLILSGRFNQSSVVIAVVVADPVHQPKRRPILFPSLWHQVKKIMGAEQRFTSASVAGVSVEDLPGLVFVEHTQTGEFVNCEIPHLVIVIDFSFHDLVFRK